MMADEIEVKVQKVVKEPRISLTMISRYIVATEKGKKRILLVGITGMLTRRFRGKLTSLRTGGMVQQML
jgi:hypothetical protein